MLQVATARDSLLEMRLRREKFPMGDVIDLSAQLTGSGIGMFHLRRGLTPGRDQSRAEGGLQEQLVLDALGHIREGCKQRQSFREMRNHLSIRAALEGSVSGLLQIHHSPMRILSPLKVHG
jgi:hypothetical protein